MSAPQLIHLVGPQGSGKTVLAGLLAAGLRAQGRAVDVVDDEQAYGKSNISIRREHSGYQVVIVTAPFKQCRHGELQAGDIVLTLERGE